MLSTGRVQRHRKRFHRKQFFVYGFSDFIPPSSLLNSSISHILSV